MTYKRLLTTLVLLKDKYIYNIFDINDNKYIKTNIYSLDNFSNLVEKIYYINSCDFIIDYNKNKLTIKIDGIKNN